MAERLSADNHRGQNTTSNGGNPHHKKGARQLTVQGGKEARKLAEVVIKKDLAS